MNLDITQDNLYLILPSKVSRMAEMLADDNDISIIDAVKQVYASEVYQRLEQESTKQWHLGPVALYQELRGMMAMRTKSALQALVIKWKRLASASTMVMSLQNRLMEQCAVHSSSMSSFLVPYRRILTLLCLSKRPWTTSATR